MLPRSKVAANFVLPIPLALLNIFHRFVLPFLSSYRTPSVPFLTLSRCCCLCRALSICLAFSSLRSKRNDPFCCRRKKGRKRREKRRRSHWPCAVVRAISRIFQFQIQACRHTALAPFRVFSGVYTILCALAFSTDTLVPAHV